MLSSQTKDPVTHQATMNLRQNLAGGLTLASLLASTPEEINACISKVGFHNVKTANLKKLAVSLRDDHAGLVPRDLPSLLALSGVGPKMGILYLQSIGINAGIGVDVHVHRISNRLGWVKTDKPEQTRLSLESWLPSELHGEINVMLVGFGQEICKPVGPRCDLCNVAQIGRLCPSKKVVSPRKVSPVKKKVKLDDEEEAKAIDGDSSPKIKISIKVEMELQQVHGGEEMIKTEDVEREVQGLNW